MRCATGAALACLAMLTLGGSARGQEPKKGGARPADPLRVLFIGNSLTAAHGLPAMVQALAKADGQRPLVVQSVVVGGFSLEDHWARGDARRAIARGKWDVVVLQQGPSALEESRTQLIRDAKRFGELIRRAGAKPALYMVWPSTQRAEDFDRVCESYRLAAAEVDGLLFPVGEAWRAAWRLDPRLELYSPDGLHPTSAGSYLAALVIYEKLYNRTPIGLPARLTLTSRRSVKVGATPEQVEVMQKSAVKANAATAPAKVETIPDDRR